MLDLDGLRDQPLDPMLVSQIHGAAYLIPGLLARFGRVELPPTGGCQIGDQPAGRRPVEQYLKVLNRFGARGNISNDGSLVLVADQLTGCEIDLRDFVANLELLSGPKYSGATKTAILAAAAAKGTTRLHYPYPKPDVTELIRVLSTMGWSILQPDPTQVIIEGRPDRGDPRAVEHSLMSDLIEVVTWVTAAVATGGSIRLSGLTGPAVAAGLATEIALAREMGLRWEPDGPNAVVVGPTPPKHPANVTVASRGFYSDNQPFLALLASMAPGTSYIRETVWKNRFDYVAELNRLGTRIDVRGDTACITGHHPPSHAAKSLTATDLRGAAALSLAALRPSGTTRLFGIHHLRRGYQDLLGDLRSLGAHIESGAV